MAFRVWKEIIKDSLKLTDFKEEGKKLPIFKKLLTSALFCRGATQHQVSACVTIVKES